MYSEYSSLESAQPLCLSENESTLITPKKQKNTHNKSAFGAEPLISKENKIRGVYCPKTNTFYSTE